VLQAVGSAALALQVLVGKQLLTKLLADNTSKDFSSAVPSIILLAAGMAVASMVAVVRNELQRLLPEMVSRSAMQQVVDASCRADLARFEDPTFHDRLQRAIVNASIWPLQMTNGLLSVGSSALAALALGAALLTIEPLFFLLGAVAAVPLTISSLRVGRALYRFAVEQTPTDRERTYIQTLLVEKDPAKEVRAYELGGFLRFAALYERRIQALRRLVRRRTVQGAAGGLLTAVVSGGVLGLLIFFVSDGRVSLAGAGAAAAALILLGTQLQGLASGMGQLYESALFIQDFNNFVQFAPGTSPVCRHRTTPTPHRRFAGTRPCFHLPKPPKTQPFGDNHRDQGRPGGGIGRGERLRKDYARQTVGVSLLAARGPHNLGRPGFNDHGHQSGPGRAAVLFQDFVYYFLSARENISMGRWEKAGDEPAVREAAARSGA